ncbi:MAG: PhnD/SsuA/transferrin family substrate-binding protein [Phenylobacterium sp.]|uniref:PhnD/SsuA/transferrin family substrate-binding protein n=1 Tax=Phenylobacterium sp. TaxID=1871053 RepID=UPI00391D8E43
MRAPAAALMLALSATAAAAEPAPLRLASIGAAEAPCRPLEASDPAGERAYHRLLEQRLGRPVLKCPVPDKAAAARGLAAGRLDLAVLDPETYTPVRAQTRAILTVRPRGRLNRIPVVAAVKANAPIRSLAAAKGTRLVYGGTWPAAHATPSQALADQDAGAGHFASETVARDPDAAVAALRGGSADVMVLNAAAWQRLCRGDRPQENKCADLREVWRGRPRATAALVARRDLPEELRFRLVGIHVAMHIEAKEAFTWASAWIPDGAEFEPTEAEALAIAAR